MSTIRNVVLSECDLLRPADDDKDNGDKNDGSQLVDSLKMRPAQREQK